MLTLTEAQLAALQARIKASSRKVEPSKGGTGGLLGRGTGRDDEMRAARARNAKRLKGAPGARGTRGAGRPCTCHPDDNPPVPCPKKYALTECRAAAEDSAVKAAIAHGKMIERIRGLPDTTLAAKAQERGKSTPGKPRLREAQVLRACMDILKAHPKCALVWRQNTGAVKLDGRHLRFSFPGASDIMGVMAGSGKFLACEVKRTGGKATPEQEAFLSNVSNAGGYSMSVDDPAYLAAWLAEI